MDGRPSIPDGLRQRDEGVLRRIADANVARLYRAARSAGHSPADADDLVQDVFLTFMASLDRFEGRSQISTWLYGILVRKMQERRRATRRDEGHDAIDDVWEAHFKPDGTWLRMPVDPAEALTGKRARLAIRDCLTALPSLAREVFVLRQIEGLNTAEVSEALSLTATHVGVLLHRARQRMRVCLGEKGWRTSS